MPTFLLGIVEIRFVLLDHRLESNPFGWLYDERLPLIRLQFSAISVAYDKIWVHKLVYQSSLQIIENYITRKYVLSRHVFLFSFLFFFRVFFQDSNYKHNKALLVFSFKNLVLYKRLRNKKDVSLTLFIRIYIDSDYYYTLDSPSGFCLLQRFPLCFFSFHHPFLNREFVTENIIEKCILLLIINIFHSYYSIIGNYYY